MKTKIYSIAIALFIAFGCSNKMLRRAEASHKNEQYSTASKSYEAALKDDASDNDPKAMLHLADCYYHMNRYADAEKWYSRAISSSDATDLDKKHYAEVLKAQGKCEEANTVLDDYIKNNPHDAVAKNMKESCRTAKVVTAADSLYAVNMLHMGFVGSSFSPSKYGDQLFVTANASRLDGGPVDEYTGNGFLDLFVVTVKDSENVAFGETANADDELNLSVVVGPSIKVNSLSEVNTQYHEGAAIISPDGKMLFFTRSKMKNNHPVKSLDNENHLELVSAEMVDGKWTNVTPLPFSNKDYSAGHPAMTSDGKRLYFISDMPGGYGGTDVYYSDYKKGEWSKPVNAGAAINTAGNEMFPVIRKMETGRDVLYYSSNGLAGDGGLDLFRADMNNDLPGTPEHLGSPFNSTYDDFGICFNDDGNSGYFSSNRGNNDGTDNIYAFRRRPMNIFIKAHVLYKESMMPVPQNALEVNNKKTSNVQNLKTDDNGVVIFKADSLTPYSLIASKEGYLTAFKDVTTPGFSGRLSDTVDVTLLLEGIVINKAIRIENIYYDFDKSNIRPEAAVELDKIVRIMKDNPGVKIELGSHCDSRGSYAYNDALSQRRSNSAVAYIISKGISADRITAKGYGERQLLNKCSDGVPCTEEEHQWNRRTEFKVTGNDLNLKSEQ
jgi:outer membrane protein OmpA-like peptidoglycan-associated protein/tetratricopeptide (TPR) repeat protein